MKSHYQIVIVGAGTGGIMAASQLLRANPSLDIAIIDPAANHYYQPAWTLVGAGTYDFEKTVRPMKSLIPAQAKWIQESVSVLHPEDSKVELNTGMTIGYDYLILSPGLVYDYSMIEGLKEGLDQGVVCSNYINPRHTWECLKNFKGGNAIFTQPDTPIKCGGAPQKILYLAGDYFRKNDLLNKTNITFATPGSVIFGIKKVADTLNEVLKRYHIDFKPLLTPVKIDPDNKIIYFKKKSTNESEVKNEEAQLVEMPFDLLHLAPPQTAPSFIQHSDLSNEQGWLEVDIHSMQHPRYENVFGIGDVAGLPTAKTGAAIRKQAPVVVNNILNLMRGKKADDKSYEGYSSCPLITGYGKMVLAEFNYKNEFTPDPKLKSMLVFNSHKEHWRLWILKKYILPYLYWNKMMKGKDV